MQLFHVQWFKNVVERIRCTHLIIYLLLCCIQPDEVAMGQQMGRKHRVTLGSTLRRGYKDPVYCPQPIVAFVYVAETNNSIREGKSRDFLTPLLVFQFASKTVNTHGVLNGRMCQGLNKFQGVSYQELFKVPILEQFNLMESPSFY
jgi:hypothetical protein